jgi:ketosteroid isomerase-like protein
VTATDFGVLVQAREEVAMTDEQYRELIESLLGHGKLRLDAQAEHDLRHEDYVMEMPQSGERIRGRDKMRAMQEQFPNPPKGELRRIVGSGDVWVMEMTSDYGDDGVYHVADIIEFRDGRILRETRYYGEPFPPPEWRSPWVEKM